MDISIVMVEYHCIDRIENCVASVRDHLRALNWECVVTSNSEYSSRELKSMQERLSGVRVIANDRNRGYAGGVNRTFSVATAPYVLVLNPDCLLTDNNVSKLLRIMQNGLSIAVLGPKVIDSYTRIQPSCRQFPKPWTFLLVRSLLQKLPGAWRERRRYLMEDFDHNMARDVDWVSGGAMLVRKSAIDTVGPMDERYFLYMEDVDWCRTFWKTGFRVRYAPECTVIHAGQHESIRGGLRSLASRHFWSHLASIVKYFQKWGWFSQESWLRKSGQGV